MLEELVTQLDGYGGLWLLCAVSGLGVPVPEDVTLLYAGIRVGDGSFGVGPTLAAAGSGIYLRDLIAWTIGRTLGAEDGRIARWMPERQLRRARALFDRHGHRAVLMGRFMIGFRVPVIVVAGAAGVPLGTFARWDLLGLAITTPLLLGAGWAFGAPFVAVAQQVFSRLWMIWVPALVVLAVRAWRSRTDGEREVT